MAAGACCMDWPLCHHQVKSDYEAPTLCPRCGTTTVADWAQPLGDGDVEPIARCPACGWTS